MTTWQQAYPGQGAPPPAGFQVPQPGYPYPQQPAYQPGYPPPGYPQPGMPQQGFAPPDYPQQGYGELYNNSSYDDQGYGGDAFSDQAVRRSFIRKVYGILTCQLLVTLGIIAFFIFHEPTKIYVRQNIWLYYVGFAFALVLIITLACCGEVRRKFPINFILLGLFTLVEGFMLGCVSSMHDADAVMLAVGITAAIVLGLTLFAFQTKWDFTAMGSILMICFVCLFLFGIIAIFARVPILSLIYACIGAVLFSFYIVYDTQLMMGGKHKYSLSPEEYIFAALNLYVDIINLFMMILSIIGYARD